MLVIADTSSLNYLILLGHVDVLRALYGRVVIPHAVQAEMLALKAPPAVSVWALALPDWIDIVSARRIDLSLSSELGEGEAEAISLAIEMAADVILMDDRLGREAAEERGLFVSGTLSVLLNAARLVLLDFETEMERLKRIGFRMTTALEELMRRVAKNG